MISGDIQLRSRTGRRSTPRSVPSSQAGRPQLMPTGAVTDLGTGRQRMARMFSITSPNKRHSALITAAPKKPRGLKAGSDSARYVAECRARATRLERAKKAVKVRALAETGLTRTEASDRLGISMGHLRRIALEHGIRFANDRRTP